MSLSRPFMVNLYWGGNVRYENGFIYGDDLTRTTTIVMSRRLSFEEFVDLIYGYIRVDKNSFKLELLLCYVYLNMPQVIELWGNDSLATMFFLADRDENFWGQIHVKIEPLFTSQQSTFQSQPSFQQYPTTIQNQPSLPEYPSIMQSQPSYHELPTISTNPLQTVTDDVDRAGFENSDACSSEHSEDTEEEPVGGDESEDDQNDAVHEEEVGGGQYEQAEDDYMPDFEDEEPLDVWSQEENKIRVGMTFKNKKEIQHAVRLWSVSQNREIWVNKSEPRLFNARCRSRKPGFTQVAGAPACNWYVRAVKKFNHHNWTIKRWVTSHNCYGTVTRNNNRSITSQMIASLIKHSVTLDVAYPIKHIMADIKNSQNVDVTYQKAWHGRKKAIESIHGSWQSNFSELPSYIAALKATNPDTIVEWQHHPQYSDDGYVFKYVFWAFGPAVEAFKFCQPVMCVDGTHLKGSYKGKLLTAVTKDANNHILPFAFAIVDEETVESWCWFFQQLRTHVVADRKLCVISDRHNGIIHAMENLLGWMHPFGYHRFCLRHVRSNFTKKYKTTAMKKLCWAIGSTTQARKYDDSIDDMMHLDTEAWNYLDQIDKSKWTLLYDENHRRWGWLTTNIAECFNNVLRGARLLPIKALIDFTFNKCVDHFRKHAQIARNCDTPLPPRMWKMFTEREVYAQRHNITEFNYETGVYRVESRFNPNDTGGNVCTVNFGGRRKTCTCGKWQNHRFPCSHSMAAIRHRGEQLADHVNKVYKTETYKRMYRSNFQPLPHVAYWVDPGWKIQADLSRFSRSRGRRRTNRIRNEMDVQPIDAPRRCTACNQPGHNISTCNNN